MIHVVSFYIVRDTDIYAGRLKSMEPWVCSIRPENFKEEVLLERKPVLLVCMTDDDSFSKQWKVLENVAARYEKELKVGLLAPDSIEIFKKRLQIIGTPTFLLMREGQEINRILGVSDEKTLTSLIDQYISAYL
jgi:thioredoxin-like negative regulator of GroEL